MTAPIRRLIILCNALDDRTRIERGISSDSPAASRKVFLAARAIAGVGVRPLVISMGRGRPDGSAHSFGATARRHLGVPIIYLRFTHRRILSRVISMFAPVGVLWRLRRSRGSKTIVFYNQLPAYVPALITARLFGFLPVLDLEDGSTDHSGLLVRAADAARRAPFNLLCSRALLACSSLASKTQLRPALSYYGTVDEASSPRDWTAPKLHVLLGGTIDPETGAALVANAIIRLRQEQTEWAKSLVFEVTGKGCYIPLLAKLAEDTNAPLLIVHGRTTDAEYRAIMARAHVGLALKLNHGPLANTTFPSKVTEMAGAGLLVLSTDISDVRAVLGDGAQYLERDDVELLIERLQNIVMRPTEAGATAARGTAAALRICAPERAGRLLASFLFPEKA